MRNPYKVGVLSLAIGCVHTNAAVLDPSALYQKTCADAVVVYTSPERVGKPYREVALLNSKGESGWTSEAGMVKSQRKKAADVGANGLILSGVDEPKAGTKIIGALLGTGAERKGKALAIYVPEDSAKTVNTCSNKQERASSTTPTTPQPSPAPAPPKAAPTPGPVTASGLVDDGPPGTNWVADAKARLYYAAGCPATVRIAPADRLYYGTESALRTAGFTKSDEC